MLTFAARIYPKVTYQYLIELGNQGSYYGVASKQPLMALFFCRNVISSWICFTYNLIFGSNELSRRKQPVYAYFESTCSTDDGTRGCMFSLSH
jgi:hypothetical protein